MRNTFKTTKIIRKKESTNLKLPVYFYFQDENCLDEYIKVSKDGQIRIKYDYFGVTINKSQFIDEFNKYHLQNLTTKERFEEALKEALINFQ